MRKILTASAVAVALVAGQAAAAGAAQQSIRVGDRIGAPMGDEDNQWQGFGGLGVGASITIAVASAVALGLVVNEVTSDDDPVSG